MGGLISRVRFIIDIILAISSVYDQVSKRLEESPGIPVQKPSTPYWAIPAAPIARHGADASEVPEDADIVIIGSGITGTSIARTLLQKHPENNSGLDTNSTLRVVMLEARDVCSGATGRNGGHITPPLYSEYPDLKRRHGSLTAQSIIRFRLAHLAELLRVAKEEDLLNDSQARETQSFDVFFERTFFDDMKGRLKLYLEDLPGEKENWSILEGTDCIEYLQCSDQAVGAISTKAGAIHPYRFVTGILSSLLRKFPKTFQLFTHTPCMTVSSSKKNGCTHYIVHTPKGTIRTQHVVHATNAWASHLLEPMRGKILPVRGNMTAQRPGRGLGRIRGPQAIASNASSETWLGNRNFIFYPGVNEERFDYLTQQPPSPETSPSAESTYPAPSGEFMFGGGFWQGGFAERALKEELGNVGDQSWNLGISAYLSGALSVYFSEWGAEGGDEADNASSASDSGVYKGRVKKAWSGIIGISADRIPWVGRLPEEISGRSSQGNMALDSLSVGSSISDKAKQLRLSTDVSSPIHLVAPGEWIAAGFTGEGMTHAWMSGKALGYMLLGLDNHQTASSTKKIDCSRDSTLSQFDSDRLGDWFPDIFRVTVKRWKKASLDNF